MAPTGRAAFIIGEKCKTQASTIHKAIYHLAKLKSISQNKESEDDGLAKVEMYYNDKGSYTYMKPISSLGENDKKLLELCLKF
jgi:hypothetical protein